MFSVCANPKCQMPFDYEHGRLFRFRKDAAPDKNPPNIHACNISGFAANARIFTPWNGIPEQTRCDDAQEFAGNIDQPRHHPFYGCRLAGYIHRHTANGMKDCCPSTGRNSIVPGVLMPSGTMELQSFT
jgi:hypothetical protein